MTSISIQIGKRKTLIFSAAAALTATVCVCVCLDPPEPVVRHAGTQLAGVCVGGCMVVAGRQVVPLRS